MQDKAMLEKNCKVHDVFLLQIYFMNLSSRDQKRDRAKMHDYNIYIQKCSHKISITGKNAAINSIVFNFAETFIMGSSLGPCFVALFLFTLCDI